MSRVMKSLMMVVLSFSFVGCSQRPIITVEVLQTSTSSPSLAEPTLTSTPPAEISTIAATPTAPLMPPDFSPILYGKKFDANTFFILLGGLREDVWLAPDLAAVQFAHIPSTAYDIYAFAGDHFEVHGHSPQFSPPHKIYTVGTDLTVDEIGMVGVARGWPILQRDVQELGSDNELYRQVLLDWLAAEGVAEPRFDTLHVFRVDLEGDSVDEIFLSATRLDESQHYTQAGDYSVVLMRKVVGNEAVIHHITGDIYSSQEPEITYPRTYSLANFIDLNRDGVLEVIVEIQGWEKVGAIVYQIDGEDVIETLRVE